MLNTNPVPWKQIQNLDLDFVKISEFINLSKRILSKCHSFGPVSFYSQSMDHESIKQIISWWRHQMETFSALLALCAGNSPVTGEFSKQMPVTRSFDVFFDRRLNKRLCSHSWGWWFETPSRSLWRHCNVKFPLALVRHFPPSGIQWISLQLVSCFHEPRFGLRKAGLYKHKGFWNQFRFRSNRISLHRLV